MNDADLYRGIRVADFSQGIAGPYSGALLAQYGAEVIKVEPPAGDWVRGMGKKFADQTALTMMSSRGKRSLALDIRKSEGREVAKRLIARSDVVIENNRPGVMARLGLDYETVKRPELIYLSVTGFGQTSPHKDRPATDTIVQAFTGMTVGNAMPDGTPQRIGVLIPDPVTALYGFQAVALALYGRAMGRGGRYLDVSLAQSMAALQAYKLIEAAIETGKPEALAVPAGTFRTADGWMTMGVVTEDQWQRLCPAMDRPALANDPLYATFAERRANRDALMALIQEIFVGRGTSDWLARLGKADILANRVNGYTEFLADPHVAATGAVRWIEQPGVGRMPVAAIPAAQPGDESVLLSPAVGQHSRPVLTELGLSGAEIDALVTQGVVAEAKAAVPA